MTVKTGLGYDVHRLVKGRRLVLGGVEIPHHCGLDGHSDADVLLHAVCDALLGAAGKGDIGEHFPNTDPKYKNISSLKLLAEVYQIVRKAGYKIVNVDTVILVQEPHLKDFKPRMMANIAAALKLKNEDVNIKATTQEGLGFVGNKEGMAAYAIVTLEKKE